MSEGELGLVLLAEARRVPCTRIAEGPAEAQALAERGIVAEWPGCGLPDALHADSGPDFRSAAFERACANFGIERIVRPVRRPRYGGHVERLIGTAQAALHLLPGTTFSNAVARDGYDSDERAR